MASNSGSRSGAGKKNTSSSSRTRAGSNTKSSSAGKPRSRTTQERVRTEEENAITNEIILIGVFALSVLLFLCNFGVIGPVGNAVSSCMFGIFGMVAYVVPVLIFVGLAFGISNRGNVFASMKIVAAVLLILLVGVMLELIGGQVPSMESYSIVQLYTVSAESKAGGGVLSGSLAYLMDHFLGMVGAVLLVVVLAIICLVLITERSFVGGVKSGSRRVYETAREDARVRKERARIRREESDARREEQQRRKEEESARRDAEKILRMDKKVSGVMLNTALTEEERAAGAETDGEYKGPFPVKGRNLGKETVKNEDLQRNPSGTEPLNTEPSTKKDTGTPGRGNILNFDRIRIHNSSVAEEEEKIAAESCMPEEKEQPPEDPLAKVYRDADVFRDMKAVTPIHITAHPVSDEDEPDKDSRKPGQEPDWNSGFGQEESFTEADIEEELLLQPDRDRKLEHDSFPGTGFGLQEAATPVPGEEELPFREDVDRTQEDKPDFLRELEDEPAVPVSRPRAVLREDSHGLPGTAGTGNGTDRMKPASTNRTGNNTAGNAAEKAGSQTAPARPPQKERPYRFPPLSLLKKLMGGDGKNAARELKNTAAKLQQTLATFGVNVTITDISQGPAVTRYEMQPEQGVKVSKILGLSDDIKLNLAATDIRIEAPIPGKAAVGIEVPNKENTMVGLRDLLESREFREFPSRLAFAVGKDIGGKVVVSDIAKMPHMLIAGATGSGKSVCINTLIMSILYKAKPDEVKLILIDPKVVELSVYNGIPHLLIPVVTDPKQASSALHWGVAEMESRYQKFADMNVRDLKGFNKKAEEMKKKGQADAPEIMPQIVIVVDELADLMMVAPGEVEESICRLAQLARAAGIHLIIATQRPSVDVITGLIKANMPSRVAFAVSSGVDSRTILDMVGAEKLLGKGDMLFYPQGYPKPVRIQGAFVSDEEVSDVVDYLKNQVIGNVYDEQILEKVKVMENGGTSTGGEPGAPERDSYFEQAGKFIIDKDKASIGMLQRVFKIGFNRAARIMDQLAEAGVVGEEEGTKPRKVLMSEEQFEQYIEECL